MIPALAFSALGLAWALTALLLRHPQITRLADQPNARSSHCVPTPRGGGLSIVTATTLGILVLYLAGDLPAGAAAALGLAALGVAAIGLWDDMHSAPVAVRMGMHFGAAAVAVWCLRGGITQLPLGTWLLPLGVAGPIICVLAVVWTLNLFNFMDGIDGIAASEAAFVLSAAAGIGIGVLHASWSQFAPELIAAAACLGFLLWNWSPAAIFMGDVGSGYLGFFIAVCGLHSARSGALNVYAWLILGGVFFVDATVTLLRRLLRGERVHQAHRSHAYQWISRRWDSHAKTSAAVIAINLLWLLPCALCTALRPQWAAWLCALALSPLLVLALMCGAGKAE